jgi:Methylase involved in ubiquinone/menaquinone biosynthesis
VSFTISFDDNNQELVISGGMTPRWAEDLHDLRSQFMAALKGVLGRLYVNVKNLRRLNNTGFVEVAKLVLDAARQRPTSDHHHHLQRLRLVDPAIRPALQLAPNITVEEYDKDFYPGQTMTEDAGFIPILRNQTKITWRHERNILPRHGLKPGLEVADICCGIGDFPVLLYKEFKPSRLVAMDHSKPSLAYARKVAEEFGIRDIEFTFGDAADMLLDDNQFDFVTCRHSLLVFNRPELIVKELFRICKPGGRVYITNEKNSHCLGEPRGESIQWSYNQVPALYTHFQMDIELGPKQRGLMVDAGFDESAWNPSWSPIWTATRRNSPM